MASRKRGLQNAEHGRRAKKAQKTQQVTSSVTTRGAKRRSVSDAVFLTSELLENILEYLPMRDLLISQRVARKWRAVISESTKLQQALFMVPREAETGWKLLRNDSGSIVRIDTVVIANETRASEADNVTMVKHGDLNPMFFQVNDQFHDLWEELQNNGDVIFEFQERFRRPRPSRTWMKHPEASWRKMLLTQPPVRSFWYHWAYIKPRGPLGVGTVTQTKDLTVANMFDTLEKFEDRGNANFDFQSHFMHFAPEDFTCVLEGDQAEINAWMTCQETDERNEKGD